MTTDTFQYDHGALAWRQVVVAHLLVFNGFGYFSAFSLFQSHWETLLSRPNSDIAWVGSIQLFLLFFVGTLSGRAMDAGHFRSLLLLGCSVQILSIFTTSAVSEYWHLLLSQGVAQGLGSGLLFTPLVTLVSLYFRKHRTLALSLAACGAPLGGVIFTVITRQLTPRIGFPWTIRVMAFLVFANSILILSLARPRELPKSPASFIDLQAFTEPVYVSYSLSIFLILWGLYTAYFYLNTYGQAVIHIPDSQSLNLLIGLNAAGIAGRILSALLADRFLGPLNVLIPSALATGILLFSWSAINTYPRYIGFSVMYGLFANAVQSLFPATLVGLTKNASKMGVRTGMVFTIGSIACLTGGPIAGALIDSSGGSYFSMQMFSGSVVVAGSLVLIMTRALQVRELQSM